MEFWISEIVDGSSYNFYLMHSKIAVNIIILVLPTQGELKKKDNLTAAKDSVQDELERLQVCVCVHC